MKKIFILTLMLCMLIPNVAFGSGYTEEEMNNRETVTYGGEEYIAADQPVKVRASSSGLVSEEPFVGSDGKYYPKGSYIISYDENGKTGNVKESDNITFGDRKISGGNDKTVEIETLAKPVIEYDVGTYDYPRAEVGDYEGEIWESKEEWIESLNERGYLFDVLPEGEEKWTIETYWAYWKPISERTNLELNEFDFVQLLHDVKFASRKVEAEYRDGKLIYRYESDEGIVGVIGFGNDDEMRMLSDYYKLYNIRGQGSEPVILTEEIIREIIKALEEELPPGEEIPKGVWSQYKLPSVYGNVGSEFYDVETAIPTSEFVNGSISASAMTWYYKIKAKPAAESYTIDNITIKWEPYDYTWIQTTNTYEENESGEKILIGTEEIEHTEKRYRYSETLTITGTYNTFYYAVENAEMNVLAGGSVSNNATGVLASLGSASIAGTLDRSGGIVFDEDLMDSTSFTSTGTTKENAIAWAQYKIGQRIKAASYVKNDNLVIKNTVLTGKTEIGEEFKESPEIYPSVYAEPKQEERISNSGKKQILASTPNGKYDSSASAIYAKVPGFDGKSTFTSGASPSHIFVHTPVVNETTINNITTSPFINQKVSVDNSRKYLMLDEDFTVTIPDAGNHIRAKGYEYRIYNSRAGYETTNMQTNWGKTKDVKLSFDAYLHVVNGSSVTKEFIPKDTWLSSKGFATSSNTYTFTIPVWAEEGNGTIETRVIAENGGNYNKGEEYPAQKVAERANLDPAMYIASKTVNVEIIGKIYDLRISSTNDPGWTSLKGEDGAYIKASEFAFGTEGQNGLSAYKYAPKLGYTINFDFKTKGIKSENVDVSIRPEGFYFVSKNGGEAEKVDLYYHTTNTKYVKIEPSDSKINLITRISKLKVTQSELTDSARIMISKLKVPYTYNQDVKIGTLNKMLVPENLRLCYNNFEEAMKLYNKDDRTKIIADAAINGFSYTYDDSEKWMALQGDGTDTMIASVGHWYAGYKLPASTIAVAKGTSRNAIMNNPNLAKKDGYILVRFEIVTNSKEGDYLKYTGPESINEETGDNTGMFVEDENGVLLDWTEGEKNPPKTQEIKLPNGADANVPIGTVVVFESDLRSTNDYENEGTH